MIGYSRAADLLMTSRAVNAEEAYRIGLLDRLVPHAALVEESIKLANEMTGWPPLALRMTKRVLQHNTDAEFEDALRYEFGRPRLRPQGPERCPRVRGWRSWRSASRSTPGRSLVNAR